MTTSPLEANTPMHTIADSHVILDKLDDAFEGMIYDETFVNGWFSVRKTIRTRYPKKPSDGTTEPPPQPTTPPSSA
jgi:hypothetical protein